MNYETQSHGLKHTQKQRDVHLVSIRKNKRNEAFMASRQFKLDVIQSDGNTKQLSPENMINITNEAFLRTYTDDDIKMLIDELLQNDLHNLHFAIIGLRKLTCTSEEVFNAANANNILNTIVPRLMDLLQDDSIPHLQYEILWILTNISAISSGGALNLLNKAYFITFLALLKNQLIDFRLAVLTILGNMACFNIIQEQFIQSEIPTYMINLLEKCIISEAEDVDILASNRIEANKITWLLSGIYRGPKLKEIVGSYETIKMIELLILYLEEETQLENMYDAFLILSEFSSLRNIPKILDSNKLALKSMQVINIAGLRILKVVLGLLINIINHYEHLVDNIINIVSPSLLMHTDLIMYKGVLHLFYYLTRKNNQLVDNLVNESKWSKRIVSQMENVDIKSVYFSIVIITHLIKYYSNYQDYCPASTVNLQCSIVGISTQDGECIVASLVLIHEIVNYAYIQQNANGLYNELLDNVIAYYDVNGVFNIISDIYTLEGLPDMGTVLHLSDAILKKCKQSALPMDVNNIDDEDEEEINEGLASDYVHQEIQNRHSIFNVGKGNPAITKKLLDAIKNAEN
jgi:hypothetical protein